MPGAPSLSAPGGEYRVAMLCASVLVLEGVDLGAMAFTLPALSESWHLRPVAFTAALTAGSVGLFLGSLLCGWLGDKVGRKPVLMGCVAVFGIMSLLTALVTNTGWLTVCRFVTGLGIGGGIPTSIALLSDFSPARRQGGMVMAMTCGVPAGNVLGGFIAARLLKPFGWQAVFIAGGVIPLILLPLLFFLLPESSAFRAARLARTAVTSATRNTIAQLFTPEFARLTLLLWLINFLSLLTIYFINSWLPSMLHSLGIATSTAILASTMFQVGGIVGGLASGPLVNKFGTEKVVAAMLAMGACWLVLLGRRQALSRCAASKKRWPRWIISTCITTYCAISWIRVGSTKRTSGTCRGRSGSRRKPSTPAPSEKIAFRFGRVLMKPGGGRKPEK